MTDAVNVPEPSASPSESRRPYDARRRRQHAESARRTVLARARELFLAQGFGNTTVAQIARSAGVSAESVYKNFGGKAGLVRAIQEESLLGRGVSAEMAADTMFTCTAPELYETLVVKRGWSPERYGRFVSTTLIAHLL